MVKEENTLINIAKCDDDLVFASKIEVISKKWSLWSPFVSL